jgi:processive 1,2-diacylglycerol beta-glucosyltransferase
MMQRPTILILTSYTGGGHISLAEALRDRLSPEYHVEMADPQPRFFHVHYRLVSRYALWLWAAEFRQTDTPKKALFAHRLFTPLVALPLSSLIKRLQPTLIVTTYPFLTYEVSSVLTRLRLSIPFVLLFADPNGVHASWLTQRASTLVFAPTRETYEQALHSGFLPDQVHLVGWPVRSQFQSPSRYDRTRLLTDLGLSPGLFTVFLQGGGEGAAQFTRTVERVLQMSEDLQLILATGTHQDLYKRFRSVPRLYPLPFTREIAPYMAAADVVMGKAGPNMLFESVSLGKPFIATTYIPGQEQANLAFIQRHSLGWVALTSQEQDNLLSRLLTSREELAHMQQQVESYRTWNAQANNKIVPLLHSFLPDSPLS